LFGSSEKPNVSAFKSKISPSLPRRQFENSDDAKESVVASWLKKEKGNKLDVGNQIGVESGTINEIIKQNKDDESQGSKRLSPKMKNTNQTSKISPAALLVRSKIGDLDNRPDDEGHSKSTSVRAEVGPEKQKITSVEKSVLGDSNEAITPYPTSNKNPVDAPETTTVTTKRAETAVEIPEISSTMQHVVGSRLVEKDAAKTALPSLKTLDPQSKDVLPTIILSVSATDAVASKATDAAASKATDSVASKASDAVASKASDAAASNAAASKATYAAASKATDAAASKATDADASKFTDAESSKATDAGATKVEIPSVKVSDGSVDSGSASTSTQITSFSSPVPITATLSVSASPDILATAAEIVSSPNLTLASGTETTTTTAKSNSDAASSVASLASTFEGRFQSAVNSVIETSQPDTPRGKVSATAAKLQESLEHLQAGDTRKLYHEGIVVNSGGMAPQADVVVVRPHADSDAGDRPHANSFGNSFVNPLFVPPDKPAAPKPNAEQKPIMRRQTAAPRRSNPGSQTPSALVGTFADELKKMQTLQRKSYVPIGSEKNGGMVGEDGNNDRPRLLRGKSADSITIASEEKVPEEIHLSPGWKKVFDQQSGSDVYVHDHSKTRWFAGHSADGKVYFYSEDYSQSAWTLPDIRPTSPPPPPPDATVFPQRPQLVSPSISYEDDDDERLASIEEDDDGKTNDPNNNKDVVRCKGWLNYAKLPSDCSASSTKKKNWAKGYVMLVSQWLVFYQDKKRAKSLPNHPFGKYECKYNLHGASIGDGKDKTKKPFAIFVAIDEKEGSVLLQNDNFSIMDGWRLELKKASSTSEPVQQKNSLTSPPMSPKQPEGSLLPHLPVPQPNEHHQPPSSKKSFKDNHDHKSTSRQSIFRRKRTESGSADHGGGGGGGDIGTRLDSWFRRRPTIHDVREKGIHKCCNVFGADLDQLVEKDAHKLMSVSSSQSKGQFRVVPEFVSKCIDALESRNELSNDGLYRINGNQAEIQRLRFYVDSEKPYDLTDRRWDCHVLTGSLKLFFRELMHPLIPWSAFLATADLLKSGGAAVDQAKALRVKKIISEKMSDSSFSTLRFLLSHLIRVAAVSDRNRMQASNLGIVFGPTLMWSESEMAAPANMAFNMTFQSKLVEFMLSNFTYVFA